MPDRCVVGGCDNINSRENGISLHKIPYYGDQRLDAIRRRKRWTDFVQIRRKNWTATQSSMICSDHFNPEDYARQFAWIPGQSASNSQRLKRDEIGIVAFPSVYKDRPKQMSESAEKRRRRMIFKEILQENTCSHDDREHQLQEDKVDVVQVPPVQDINDNCTISETDQEADHELVEVPSISDLPCIKSTQTPDFDCDACKFLEKRNRQLCNQWTSTKIKLKKCRYELRKKQQKNHDLSSDQSLDGNLLQEEPLNPVPLPTLCDEIPDNDSDCDMDYDSCHDYSSDVDNVTEVEMTFGDETESDGDDADQRSGVHISDGNLRDEPKHIVFLSQLLLLFNVCHFCKSDNPLVTRRVIGTMVEVKSACTNLKCRKEYIWKSQPNFPGTRIAAGNLLLCFAILMAGGSISKVSQVFKHMGLSCISLATFFRHQRNILFPSIHVHWKAYQQKLLQKVKDLGNNVVMAGDGRHDSMGHSAKYCAYTLFCCTLPLILHFTLVQRNEAGSSPAMEYMGFQNCINFILGSGVVVGAFISDRHTSIAKHMREKLSHIKHYYDLWHLKKKIQKVLVKISKEKMCEALAEWIKPCTNHFYWSVTSTITGSGKLIWSKFKSYLNHIINKHENFDDPMFKKCAHSSNIPQRKWLTKDSLVYEKVEKALTNTRLVAAIEKASAADQTSCLEGFHSVLNHFAPKMIAYSYVGMLCRHIIAVLHFNTNLHREFRKRPDGSEQISVIFPKFKNGEATIRNVKVKPSYDYVEEVYQTMVSNINSNTLTEAIEELKEMTPAAMNTMLDKEMREDAIEKFHRRKSMTVKDVPACTPEPPKEQEISTTKPPKKKKRKAPCCSECKKPMKDHKSVLTCIRNTSRSC
ncbi:uncharacterized protein LOC110233295 [Exaiptasia diaphana]|uniref:THAP-type domain-containing protein n=1 Tax=Exaiptasia diaphana TaxID=2652724 RepID=A0A913WUA5_EXADI|nr:uncharacterized protein LOC110233295 [Exaiptasia diaphana]KXJ17797.1 hypothetical protein AC249_AIPGENE23862 [Exaiptasia diaphana]